MKSISSEVIQKALESLKKNEMEAIYFPTASEAQEEVLKRIPLGATVGVGGSVTLRQMGLLEALEKEAMKFSTTGRKGCPKRTARPLPRNNKEPIFS